MNVKKELSRLVKKAKADNDILAVSIFGSFARGEKHYRDIDICLFLRGKKENLQMSKKKDIIPLPIQQQVGHPYFSAASCLYKAEHSEGRQTSLL